jgi:hypothetical protein
LARPFDLAEAGRRGVIITDGIEHYGVGSPLRYHGT